MAKIEYSPMALEDLKDINKYVMDNWGEDVAKRIISFIILKTIKLELYVY